MLQVENVQRYTQRSAKILIRSLTQILQRNLTNRSLRNLSTTIFFILYITIFWHKTIAFTLENHKISKTTHIYRGSHCYNSRTFNVERRVAKDRRTGMHESRRERKQCTAATSARFPGNLTPSSCVSFPPRIYTCIRVCALFFLVRDSIEGVELFADAAAVVAPRLFCAMTVSRARAARKFQATFFFFCYLARGIPIYSLLRHELFEERWCAEIEIFIRIPILGFDIYVGLER